MSKLALRHFLLRQHSSAAAASSSLPLPIMLGWHIKFWRSIIVHVPVVSSGRRWLEEEMCNMFPPFLPWRPCPGRSHGPTRERVGQDDDEVHGAHIIHDEGTEGKKYKTRWWSSATFVLKRNVWGWQRSIYLYVSRCVCVCSFWPGDSGHGVITDCWGGFGRQWRSRRLQWRIT